METRNIHLIKEIGMIPYYFHQIFNFDGKILTYKNDEYPFLERYCKGITLVFVKKSREFSRFNEIFEINVLKYLILNSKNINILNIIHLKFDNIIYGLLYKFLNKKGILYLKMDASEEFKKIDLYHWYRDKKEGIIDYIYLFFRKKLVSSFLKMVDLISFETKELFDFTKRQYPKLRDKIILIPNGIDDHFIKTAGIKKKSFSEKENIILIVGRIGAEEKSNETLLEAISKIKNLKDWKIFLIGSIEKHFKEYIQGFLKKNPQLKQKIFFLGEIKEREKLFEYYQKSKIFCLTSITESFGIVLVEAAFFGNYIVSSNLPFSREITMNGSIGKLFTPRDSKGLSYILQDLIDNEAIMEYNYSKIIDNTKRNYTWRKIIKNLYREILKVQII